MATRIEDDGPTRAAVLRLVVERIRLLDRACAPRAGGATETRAPETLSVNAPGAQGMKITFYQVNAPDAGACRDVVVQAAALACQRWR